jgi:hypothetical protein
MATLLSGDSLLAPTLAVDSEPDLERDLERDLDADLDLDGDLDWSDLSGVGLLDLL